MSPVACRPIPQLGSMNCSPTSGSLRIPRPGPRQRRESAAPDGRIVPTARGTYPESVLLFDPLEFALAPGALGEQAGDSTLLCSQEGDLVEHRRRVEDSRC